MQLICKLIKKVIYLIYASVRFMIEFAAFSVLCIIGSILWTYFVSDYESMHNKQFIKENWKNDIWRSSMAYDLKDNHLEKGMKMEEVEELLGHPDAWRIFDKYFMEIRCLQYDLGVLGAFYHDSYKLIICPNTANRVSSVEIVNDAAWFINRASTPKRIEYYHEVMQEKVRQEAQNEK